MTDSSPVPQDKRGFFMLPQMPEESGYYTYGTPFGGRGQYAHVQMLNFIFKLEHGWSITEAVSYTHLTLPTSDLV